MSKCAKDILYGEDPVPDVARLKAGLLYEREQECTGESLPIWMLANTVFRKKKDMCDEATWVDSTGFQI